MNNLKEIKEKYIALANIQTACSVNGKSRKANIAYKKLSNIFLKMKRDEISSNILLDLLGEDNSTRLWAASHMLGLQININIALSVLDELADIKDSASNIAMNIISFEAKMTAKIFREKRTLRF